MPSAAHLYSRHRLLGLAILASAALHAAVMVGLPLRIDALEEARAAVYEARLETAMPAPALPPPTPAAPRRPPRPRAPALVGPDVLAALPVETASDLAPELGPAPEILALAQPAVPVRELAPPPFPVDAMPPELSIDYQLTSPVADGRATYSWEREGDSYRIRGEAEAEGFFTLFLEGRVLQESRGSVTASGLRPESFTERRPNASEEGLRFDWSSRQVTFERKGETRTSPLEDNTVDWLSMIFQLAHAPPPSSGAMELQVFTQRRMYRFRLQVLGIEVIEIPLGRVRALHLRHHDPARGNESVDVWLGLEQHNLPVKMRYPVARNRFMVEQVATRVSARNP